MGTSSYYFFFKVLFAVVAVVLLLVGTLQSGDQSNKTTTKTQSLNNHVDQGLGNDNKQNAFFDQPQLDLNYMSKRRVPNGPDPIHNRRAGNSRRPPGQS